MLSNMKCAFTMEIDPALNSDESVCIDNHESNSESIVQSQPPMQTITFYDEVLVEKAANSSFTLFEKWIVDVLLIRYNL